jgi:hypothetical protein
MSIQCCPGKTGDFILIFLYSRESLVFQESQDEYIPALSQKRNHIGNRNRTGNCEERAKRVTKQSGVKRMVI